MPLPIQRYSYEDIRGKASAFLRDRHPDGSVPVPIDAIIEFKVGIDIIPLHGFLEAHEVDAFLSQDCTSIAIDEGVFKQRSPNRYRFSLAHELAHVVLHEEVYAHLEFSNVEEWKLLQKTAISDEEYRWLEWQANCFAGLILVPGGHLKAKLEDGLQLIADKGFALDTAPDIAKSYLCDWISGFFEVSSGVIKVRLDKDDLWPPPMGRTF